jgi:LysM repeat protein
MASKRQVCPICGAENPLGEHLCAICGARLTGQPTTPIASPSSSRPVPPPATNFYNFSLGEDDLMASSFSGVLILGTVLVLLGVLIAGGIYLGIQELSNGEQRNRSEVSALSTPMPSPNLTLTLLARTPRPTLPPTLTRTPPPPLPTITPPPSDTPTPGPCEVQVKEGDTLYGLALQCGHRDFAVVQEIVALNNLVSDTAIQIGQIIQIPLPTPTLDLTLIANPAIAGLPTSEGEVAVAGQAGDISAEDIIAAGQTAIIPTLDPNLQYHTVQAGQTLYDIVAIYNVDVKLLSEINPEIEFPQCDFGERFGGPTCSVIFYEGQQIRVPAPTPTPTIPPTASGSETPTPSPTATINVPTAFTPQDGESFDAAQMVTLRWTTTGTLGMNQVYGVYVKRLTTGEVFRGITCDLSFDLPPEWQANTSNFVEYEWYVVVADLSPFGMPEDVFSVRASGYELCQFAFDLPVEWDQTPSGLPDVGQLREVKLGDERFPTTPRRFVWQGRHR